MIFESDELDEIRRAMFAQRENLRMRVTVIDRIIAKIESEDDSEDDSE